MSITTIIDAVVDREGGYVNNPNDKGGETCFGITETVARQCGYAGEMKALPREFAASVYMRQYVILPGFDKVLGVSERIADEMIDTGVNMGTSLPGPWLQRILNALNQQARTFPDLLVDGNLGPATISALRTVLAQRGKDGETIIMRALNCQQGARYLEITEKRQASETFFAGWMLNRVEVN